MSDKHIQEFCATLTHLSRRHNNWQVWIDFCTMSAIAISNAIDKRHYAEREATYMSVVKRYESDEARQFSSLFAITTNALERNPDQDFLGELFMRLELGNHHKGQFFTPYNVSRCMAEMQVGDCDELINEKGFITVNDPCCGGGGMLIAFANALHRRGINYQQQVLFIAQDIDPTVSMMCYIQLSLLGCAAEILVGNTLTNEPVPSENRWYTPLYFHETWHWRRTFGALVGGRTAPESPNHIDRKEITNEGTSEEATKGLVGAQRGDITHFWIFGGFAG